MRAWSRQLVRLVVGVLCALALIWSTIHNGERELSRLVSTTANDTDDGDGDGDELGEANLVEIALTAPSPRAIRQLSGAVGNDAGFAAASPTNRALPRITIAQRLPTPPPRLLI